jgi:hypothetical protein
VADADYGDNPAFINGLEARRERRAVAVRANFTVATARWANVAGQRADELLAQVPRWQWQTIKWRERSTGWLRATGEPSLAEAANVRLYLCRPVNLAARFLTWLGFVGICVEMMEKATL